MSDYIKRTDAIDAVCGWGPNDLTEAIRADIETIPAADVRHVVLCRDCSYADYSGMGNGTVWCMEMERAMQETDFCSRGEKREES